MAEEATQSAATQATPQEAPGLTVNDLAAMVQVINVASQRGAFKADELSAVGTLYDKLSKFLTVVAPPQTQDTKESA